jgi:hypothetical protein
MLKKPDTDEIGQNAPNPLKNPAPGNNMLLNTNIKNFYKPWR